MNCHDLLSWAVFSRPHPSGQERQTLALIRETWDYLASLGYERPEGL